MSTPFEKVMVVTGGLGTGKSTACRILREIGAYVISADELAREVVVPGSPALQQITKQFSQDLLLPDGTLDRKRLGALVFSDAKERKKLEAILHPAIQELARKRFEQALQAGEKNIVYDCPLYYEAGLSTLGFGSVILISCPRELSLTRVMQRDGLSRAEAEARYDAQFPIKEKEKRAQVVIENRGSLDDLRQSLLQTLRRSSIKA